MKDDFGKTIGIAVLLTLGLLALDRVPDLLQHSRAASAAHKVVGAMHNGELNAEDFHVLAAGYYEQLRNDVPVPGVWEQGDVRPAAFVRYELRPNVNHSYAAGMRVTNSLGMANPEYPMEKPPHTRRIAILGASLSLGPYGHDYAALLEQRLNRDCLTPEIQAYQVLNFSVYGYTVVQMMDVALERASKFHPDVYLVALSSLEVMSEAGWQSQIARLMVEKADLKYDFLRKLVAQAGVLPTDRIAIVRAKLAPFYVPVTRWAIGQIKDEAASQGATVIIHLVPAPINPDFIAADFNRVHTAIDGLGVPIIDLRDTFRSANLQSLQVIPNVDIHPNGPGHEMIFQRLYAGLRANPTAWTALTGADSVVPSR